MSLEATFGEVAVADGAARAVVRPEHVRRLCEGHFPGEPLVPGAALAGLMAELAGAAVAADGGAFELVAIERASFVARVTPDAPVVVTARRDGGTRAHGEVHAGGTCAARATFRFRAA